MLPALRLALAALTALGASAPTPTRSARPTPRPTPSVFDTLRQVQDQTVTGKALNRHIVIGVRIVDAKEDFAVELANGAIEVRSGLPERASAVVSLNRSLLEKLMAGTETLSGAVRNGDLDVEGSLEEVFEMLDCCIKRKP